MGEGDKGDKGGMYYRLKKLPEGEGGRGRRSQKRRRGTIFEPIPCRRSWIPLPELMGTGDRAGDRKCRTPRPVEPSVAPPYRGGGGGGPGEPGREWADQRRCGRWRETGGGRRGPLDGCVFPRKTSDRPLGVGGGTWPTREESKRVRVNEPQPHNGSRMDMALVELY